MLVRKLENNLVKIGGQVLCSQHFYSTFTTNFWWFIKNKNKF